jgi:hypothetical protein
MAATNNFYRTPYLTTISFAVGILLFFLPFMEVKCNGTALAQMRGTDMVTGSSPKMGDEFEQMTKSFDRSDNGGIDKTTKTEREGKVYVLAIIALLLGVAGFIISLMKRGGYNKMEMLFGIIGAVTLIALMVQVKNDASSQIETGNKETDGFSSMMKVSVNFTIWFFLCVLSYLSAAFISYKQKDLVAEGLPPAKAPQLDIQNPGDQSEFPAAPTGDKDLG